MNIWIPGMILGAVVIGAGVIILCNLTRVSLLFGKLFQLGNRSPARIVPNVVVAAPAVFALLIGSGMILISVILGPPDAS